jgi:hypothetical protein
MWRNTTLLNYLQIGDKFQKVNKKGFSLLFLNWQRNCDLLIVMKKKKQILEKEICVMKTSLCNLFVHHNQDNSDLLRSQ